MKKHQNVYFHRVSWKYRFKHSGRLHEQAGFDSARAALEALWKKKQEVGATGERTRVRSTLFGSASARYLAEVVVPHHRADQWSEQHSWKLLTSRLGTRVLASITSRDVEEYKAWRLARRWCQRCARGKCKVTGVHGHQVKGATVNRDLAYLSAFFSWCMKQRPPLIDHNPCVRDLVSRFNEPERTRTAVAKPSREYLYALIEGLGGQYRRERLKAELLFNLGVRKRVVLDLEWERIDFVARLITYYSKGKDRTIPFNKRAFEIFQELGPRPSGRLFKETSDTMLRRRWAVARKTLELPHLWRHDLRVTFARELATKTADLATIQDLLGHSSLTMTRKYVPANLRAARHAVSLIEED